MRIVIFGASGLIGQGVLLESLDHPGVDPLMAAVGLATTNTAIADAMLAVAANGSDREVLGSREINRLSENS